MKSMKWTPVIALMVIIALAVTLSYVGCGGGGSSSSGSSGGPVVTGYSISGTITGSAISGVTITVTGTQSGTATTNALGQYTVSGLVNGYYSVSAVLSGSKFAPFSQVLCINDASVTGKNFTESSAASLYTVSGNITATGSTLANCVVTLDGTNGTGQVLSDINGDYVFSGIPNGDYSITPTRLGFDFNPAEIDITVNSADSPNNDFDLRNRTFSVSGTVTYGGGESGWVYVRLIESDGSQTNFGTSISPTGAYTIRGIEVSSGDYYVQAFMDTLGYSLENTAAPSGASTTLTISSGVVTDVTGKDITMTDPVSAGTVVSPTGLTVLPGDECAMIIWSVVENVSGTETAQSYNLYWSTDSNVSKSITTGGGAALNLPAQEDGTFMHRGLTNTDTFYYVVTANIGGTESDESAVASATIGAPVGNATISGTVTFPSTSGVLYIGLYSDTGLFVTSTNLATAQTSQFYTLTGVTSGTYNAFAIFDLDGNGSITLGDLTNTEDMTNPVSITTTDKTVNQTLVSVNAEFKIKSYHRDGETGQRDYGLVMEVLEGIKRPVKATINSGPFITGPIDLAKERACFNTFGFDQIRPGVGDTYQVTVVYSDGSSQNFSTGVAVVMDSFALNLAATSSTTPTLSWDAPTVEPDFYTYTVMVENTSGGRMWGYPENGGMSSDQTSVDYDFDGRAAALSGATTYRFYVLVKDRDGNVAMYIVEFTTP